jgi:16S rRNA (guanine(527)-N(7))-methyltransferase GidB
MILKYEIFEEKFVHYFKSYDIEYTGEIIKNFFGFYQRVITENEKYNLTSITDIDEAIVKHFVDSVIVLKCFEIPYGAKIIDIGTGAGFPGLPLYIMRNDLNITFLDSSAKKIKFIEDTVGLLEFETGGSLDFVCGRAEDIAKDKNFRGTYDFAVSRAVAKLNVLCELAAPLICKGGYYIAYKGKSAENELTEAHNALKILNLQVTELKKFEIINIKNEAEEIKQEENKRVLIKIKKIKETMPKYPRNFAKIIKNPL